MTRQEWDQKGIHCTLQQDATQALLVVETHGGWELVQACSEGAGFWLFFKCKNELGERDPESAQSKPNATAR